VGGVLVKSKLLASTACVGVGLVGQASATDGIKLSLGGFFNETSMVVFDDDGERGYTAVEIGMGTTLTF
jgi:hypothetical protein